MSNSILLALVRLKASFRRLMQELHKPNVLEILLKGLSTVEGKRNKYCPPSINLEQPDILIDGYIANTLLPRAQSFTRPNFKVSRNEPGSAVVPYASGWVVHRPPAPPTTTIAHPYILQPASELKGLAGEKRPTSQQRRELFECK
ncbi:hypothetical protein EI94DRAFT_1801494 [Lactarius quietus]|nr:hypothetical protein EI94DRAFT_1801494 [Lactarius quietus]